MRWLLLATIVIKSAQCEVACRYNGFDSGVFRDESCECVTLYDYNEIVFRKRFSLSSKRLEKQETETLRRIEDKAPWLLIE